ncbi:MAG: hypothetical protein FJ109_13220 [Deltaproteobacteria bacterium]|nr:hypothetical protein [Deltaproteobacteria bacterium]
MKRSLPAALPGGQTVRRQSDVPPSTRVSPLSPAAAGPRIVALAVFLLALTSAPLPPASARADEWLGKDKALHFAGSMSVGSAAFAASAWGMPDHEPWEWSAISGGSVLFAGLTKECIDLAMGKEFSGRDLAWDVAGGAVSLAVNLLVFALAAD